MTRRILPVLLALAGCGREASAPPEWTDLPGARTRPLLEAGRGTPGFTRLPATETGIDFRNALSEEASYQNRHLMHGSGVAIGDVDGNGWADVYLARIEGPNALYLNEGGWRFREAAGERGVALAESPSTGAVFADVDGDTDLDLLVTAMGGETSLLINDGAGRFTDQTAAAGLVRERRGSTTATFADVEGDGDLDLYIANYRARTMLDSLSPQERAFDQIVKQTGDRFEVIPSRRADYRVQVRDDLRGVNLIQRADPDWFYLNDGKGHFTREALAGNPRFLDEQGRPLTEEPEDFGLAARFYDVNGDGAPDLYVANDFEDPDQFWINDGTGRFRLIAAQAIRRTANSNMSVDFADVDRDGAVDLFQADMLANDHRLKTQIPTHTALPKLAGENVLRAQWQRNALLRNRGDGTFEEIADAAGVAASGWTWSSMFLDVDLDGYEDLLIGNGHTWDLMDADVQERLKSSVTGVDWRRERKFYPKLLTPNVAYRNRGDRTFEDVSAAWRFGIEPDISHGMAAGDLDGDGDLDVVINRLDAVAAVLRNDAPAPRVAVRLTGRAPNTHGIGARITVLGTGRPPQTLEVTAGGLYLSGSDQVYSFAAPPGDTLAIRVVWRSGAVSSLPAAAPGRLYEISEAGAEPVAPVPAAPDSAVRPLFEDVSARLNARHTGTPFNDYSRQPTLPFQLSQLGPGVSWIDLDRDGDDDLVVPDGAGGELVWYRNDGGTGRFARVSLGERAGELDFTMALALPRPGGLSLLVGRSSYRAKNFEEVFSTPRVLDVDVAAGGRTARPRVAVPADTASIGALAQADVDGDGDLDLFVASRVTLGAYPVPPSSSLYLNQGDRFELDAKTAPVLHHIGLVSGATFADVDGDGDPDLALAMDWGPIRLFINQGGTLTDATAQWGLAGLSGGWKGVAAGDFDGDGRLDLAATNWGVNLPWRADSAAPLVLYVGNFARTPRVDMVAAQWDPTLKAEAPLAPLSTLAWAMPELRRRIPTFAEYARASLEKVLGRPVAGMPKLVLTTLEHAIFLNRGGRFERNPLPAEAQMAPAFAPVIADFDGDGTEDLFLAQNFSQTELGTARFDAGRGLLLLNRGEGRLTPVRGRHSGVVIYGDQRGAAASDFDGDGRADLAVAQNAGEIKLYRNVGSAVGLSVRLVGGPLNPSAVGANLRVRYADGDGPVREIRAGSGYWSADGAVPVLGIRAVPTAVWVRWPGGRVTETPVPAGLREIIIREQP